MLDDIGTRVESSFEENDQRGVYRVARDIFGLLTLIPVVVGLVYAFTGPSSAVFPSLVAVALAVGVLALLYGTDSAKRYFANGSDEAARGPAGTEA